LSSAPRTSSDPRSDAPLPWLALGLAAAVVLVAFRDTWGEMARVWWTSETFGHGMIVPVLAAWLAWRSRARLDGLAAAPDRRGAIAFAAACAGWYVSQLAGVAVVAQFALTAMIPCAVWACAGWPTVRAFAGPLAFLFFMVPAGEALNPMLMEGTADATIAAIQAIGIPVYREGLHFALPTGRWSVVEACSGLRYVIAAAMLASLFALINFRTAGKRVAFVAIAIALAVLANWMRAFLVVLVGHLSGMTVGVGDDHVWFGWVFFGVAMFGVFAMGARWRDPEVADPPAVALAGGGRAADAAGRSPWSGLLPALPVVAIALGTILALDRTTDVQPRDDLARHAAASIGPLGSGPLALGPRFEGARATVAGTRADGTEVFVAYFARQREGGEMIAFGNSVLPQEGRTWAPMTREAREVQVDGRALRVLEQRVRSGGDERLVWSWFTVGGDEVGGSEYRAKAGTAWAMLRGRGDHSTVSVASVPLPALPAAASATEVAAALAAGRARLAGAAAPLARLAVEATGP
jgi:exosortase A